MTNRVSYPDKVQFASELEDEHDGVGHQTGNGIYNDFTAPITQKPYTESFKIACFRRSAFILCGFLVILILVIVIAVTAHGSTIRRNKESMLKKGNLSIEPTNKVFQHKKDPATNNSTVFYGHIQAQKGRTQFKTKGLIAYPQLEDGSTVISFDPLDSNSYKKYFENIEHKMKDYELIAQVSKPDNYVVCSNYKTAESLPEGKFCMQTALEFGEHCNHMTQYGYTVGQPCMLLVLKLDEGVKPEPYDVSTVTDQALKTKLQESVQNGTIPIVCEGRTEADRQNLIFKDIANNITETEILYNPQGYPLYRFPVKGDSKYVDPAVMVQFKTVKMDADITVRCTAWVKDGDRSSQDDGGIFSTEFTFKIYHRPAG